MIRNLPSQFRIPFGILFLNFALFGATVTVVGATLPIIIRTLDWTYLIAGFVIAANSFAYFVTTFFAGLMAHRIGLRRMIIIGLFLQALGIGFFGAYQSMAFNLGAFMLVGIGQGAIEIVTNYSVIQMEPAGQSRLMNLMHSAFTVGAIIAPFITGALIGMDVEWRSLFQCLGVASLMLTGIFFNRFVQFPELPSEEKTQRGEGLRLHKQPLLLLLVLIMFLYVGAEIGISSWISERFVRVYAMTPSEGANMLSLFWLGIFLGRLLTSVVYKGDRQEHVLLIFSVSSSVFLAAALMTNRLQLSSGLFFFVGIAFSTIYPTVMAIAGHYYKSSRGAVIGVVSTGGGVGMCLFPLVMAGIANFASIETGFWFYLILTLAMTLISGIVFRILLRSKDEQYV